jgi:hypothetical protein
MLVAGLSLRFASSDESMRAVYTSINVVAKERKGMKLEFMFLPIV